MTTPHLPRLAAMVFNRPHYITRDAGLAIANVITRGAIEPLQPQANRFVGEDQVDRDAQGRPMKWRGYRMHGTTAIVSVLGELVNRGAWLGASSGLISYEGLTQQLRAAASDSRTKRILLDVNSPGGEAAGMTDIAATVRAIASEKPVVAVANSMMASAAYGLCAGATRIVTTELGVVGSIGVVMMHADYSAMLDKQGIGITLIHEGAHKVDGNPFEALPKDVRQAFQEECARYYQAFVDCVHAGRPQLSLAAIRDTEARTYLGRDAVDVGLADAVGTFDEILADLESEGRILHSLATPRTQEATLSKKTAPAQAAETTAPAVAADVEQAPAVEIATEAPAAAAAGPAISQADLEAAATRSAAEARAAERARVKGILAHPEAAGREGLAQLLAFDTDTSPEAAATLLAAAPKAAPAAAAAPAQYMGLELAAPMAQPHAPAKVDAQSVYSRRRTSNTH